MPFVRITVPAGFSRHKRGQIADGVHEALVSVVAIPPNDRFQVIAEEERIYSHDFLGIVRSDDLVFVHITLVAGRTADVKKRLFARIVENLAKADVRPEDVHIVLVENSRVDWSVGNGIAQLVADD